MLQSQFNKSKNVDVQLNPPPITIILRLKHIRSVSHLASIYYFITRSVEFDKKWKRGQKAMVQEPKLKHFYSIINRTHLHIVLKYLMTSYEVAAQEHST